MCLVLTCLERSDLLALICGVLLCVCHFPIGILGQVWYLIVPIPDICTLTYFYRIFMELRLSVQRRNFVLVSLALTPNCRVVGPPCPSTTTLSLKEGCTL